jgi:hypothetical protein
MTEHTRFVSVAKRFGFPRNLFRVATGMIPEVYSAPDGWRAVPGHSCLS